MVGLSFLFGAVFAARGLWLILPFAGLELVAVAIAFVCYGRRAADYERITLSDADITIERVEGARTLNWRFASAWARVEVEEGAGSWMDRVRVFIVSRGERVEVGRHLSAARRKLLAQEILAALRGTAVAS
jgi:uncharacterized membrane protein